MKTVRRLFVLNGTAYDGKDRIGKPTVPVLDRTNGTAKTNGTVRTINTNRPYLYNIRQGKSVLKNLSGKPTGTTESSRLIMSQ